MFFHSLLLLDIQIDSYNHIQKNHNTAEIFIYLFLGKFSHI
jgi:hypothetical protein